MRMLKVGKEEEFPGRRKETMQGREKEEEKGFLDLIFKYGYFYH